jgi:hypothetical protein
MKILAIAAAGLLVLLEPAFAASCQLSGGECLSVAAEMKIDDAAAERESKSFASVDPSQRAKFIHQSAAFRSSERTGRLSSAIRNEIARLEFCRAEDARRARTGQPAQPSQQCIN